MKPYALRTRTLLWFGHGCSGHRMLLEHERSSNKHERSALCEEFWEGHVVKDLITGGAVCNGLRQNLGCRRGI